MRSNCARLLWCTGLMIVVACLPGSLPATLSSPVPAIDPNSVSGSLGLLGGAAIILRARKALK
jgi:hypothetical protein